MVIINKTKLEKIILNEKPQIISHHAAYIKASESIHNPSKNTQVNILGSLNLIEATKKINLEKFIFASSGGAIYDDSASTPTSELHEPCPLTPYGVAKRTIELSLASLCKTHSIPYLCLRYSNVYGPRQNTDGEGGVIAIFINQFSKEKTPIIFGDGSHVRDYIYVEDVIKANVLALKTKFNGELHIGTGIKTSTNQIYQKIQENFNLKVKPKYKKGFKEQKKSLLDSSKANLKLRWSAKVNLNYGIKKTINWFQNQ